MPNIDISRLSCHWLVVICSFYWLVAAIFYIQSSYISYDQPLKELLIVKRILLVSTLENV